MLHRRVRPLVAIVTAALIAAACSPVSLEERPVVEIFGPYRGEDAKRFTQSLTSFEEETGIDVLYIGTGAFSRDIQDRVARSDAPDIALFPQPALIKDFANQGLLVPLDAESVNQQSAKHDDILAGLVGDEKYAVWVRAVVKSLVWYSPKIFAERGYDVPESWESLMSLTAQIEADGSVPWCLSMESFGATGWVGTDWIEDIILREQGPEFYDRWVRAEIPFDDDAVIQALDTFGQIVHPPERVLGGNHRIINEPWQNAQQPMFDSEPGCLLHRQASFHQANLPSSVSIGPDTEVFLLPSMNSEQPPILVGGELAAAFSDRPEVQAVMGYLATPEAGREWAKLGGFTSPHPDFDPSWYGDPFDRRIAQIINEADVVRFDGSDLMVPSVGTGTFWSGMVTFVRTADTRLTVEEIQSGMPEVAQLPTVPIPEG